MTFWLTQRASSCLLDVPKTVAMSSGSWQAWFPAGRGPKRGHFCALCGKFWYISHREFRLTAVVTLVQPDWCGCGLGRDDPAQEVDFERVSGTPLPGPGLGR